MNKSTILIAGDDGVLASHLQNILSRQGYRIAGPFTSTEEAIAFLSGQPVDLILMDIERESISEGCAFVEQVLRLPDIPIVFLLGLSQSSLLENTGIISRHGHLVKPVQERELTVVIELTLRRFFLDRLLKKSEARYRHLFENSPLGIFRTTLDGRVLSVNPEMARLAGCDSPEEAITKCTNLAEQFYADPNQRREFITLLREKGFVTNFEYKARKKMERHCGSR